MAANFRITEGQLVTVFDPYTWKSRLVTHFYDVLAFLMSFKEACNHPRILLGGPLLSSQPSISTIPF